jgi:hypothetical protein
MNDLKFLFVMWLVVQGGSTYKTSDFLMSNHEDHQTDALHKLSKRNAEDGEDGKQML